MARSHRSGPVLVLVAASLWLSGLTPLARAQDFRSRLAALSEQVLAERQEAWTPVELTDELRSLLVPGWGQLHRGERLRGGSFLAAFTASLALAVWSGREASLAYRAYRRATTPEDAVAARRRTERADRRQLQALSAAAVVWSINLIDIYRPRRDAS